MNEINLSTATAAWLIQRIERLNDEREILNNVIDRRVARGSKKKYAKVVGYETEVRALERQIDVLSSELISRPRSLNRFPRHV